MRGTWTRRRSMREYMVMIIKTLVVLIQIEALNSNDSD